MKLNTKALGLAFLLAALPASAQVIIGGGGSSGGGGGSGDITAVVAGAGLTGGATSGSATLAASALINEQTGTSYTIDATDAAKLVTLSNGSAVAVTVPQATSSFGTGFSFGVQNKGAGTATLTPTTSTINGGATLSIAQNRGCWITSDGTNWQVDSCTALISSSAVAVGDITGFGTGIATWLATPSSANLIAALTDETGSGAAVFATSPTLVTPALGVATASSLAAGGCTIGSSAICGQGSIVTAAGNLQSSGSGQILWQGRGIMTSAGAGFIGLGAAASATPVAQTFYAQSGSGTNIAGQNWTIQGSLGTGNANSGDLLFQTGGAVAGSGTTAATATTALRIRGVNGRLSLPLLATDATLTTRTVCQDTSTNDLYFGSGTAGICLGTSSARYKHDIKPLSLGIAQIMALKPVSYKLNRDKGDPNKDLYGFLAEDMVKVTPKLVGFDKRGRPDTADYVGVIPILVKAVQEQQREIAALKKQIAARR